MAFCVPVIELRSANGLQDLEYERSFGPLIVLRNGSNSAAGESVKAGENFIMIAEDYHDLSASRVPSHRSASAVGGAQHRIIQVRIRHLTKLTRSSTSMYFQRQSLFI